ncbi:hypothetical protein MHTCC0001_04100 [Flavobacteriaceae bacterium MHTCC 0001]
MSIGIEYLLFIILPSSLSNTIERSVYNGRKRKLLSFRESLRKALVLRLNLYQDCYIIDSMPLEICKLLRSSSRSKICKEQDYSLPEKG